MESRSGRSPNHEYEMSEEPNDSPNELRQFVEKLNLWREESQNLLVYVIEYHNKKVDKGFQDLVKELYDLQAKQFVKEEREELLAGVNDVNDKGENKSNMPYNDGDKQLDLN